MLPLIAAAGQAFGSFFGGPEAAPGGPAISGGGTFATGSINVGSKVVGSGSAATAIQPPPFPGDTSAAKIAALPGSASVATGSAASVPFWQNPMLWIAGAAVLAVLLLVSSPPKK